MFRPLCALAAALLAGVSVPGSSHAGAVDDRIKSRQLLRVCIWPEYHGVTLRNPRTEMLSGIDIDMSFALAKDLGVQLAHVDSSFATLIRDLQEDRCDIAMFAVGLSPQREAALHFSQPYLHSGAYAMTSKSTRHIRHWGDIDQANHRVAVLDGTVMANRVEAWLKQAEVVRVKPPNTREQELEAGRVDVFLADYAYTRRVLDTKEWARLIEPPVPMFPMHYAYAVKQGDPQWLQRVNQFVTDIKRDGRLKAAAKKAGLSEMLLP